MRQAATFVGELSRAVEPDMARAVLARWSGERPAAARAPAPPRGAAETIARDVAQIRQVAGRLQACLVTTPLAAFETSAADVLRTSLCELESVLRALSRAVADGLATRPAAIPAVSP